MTKWLKKFAKLLIRYSVRRLPVGAKTVTFQELYKELCECKLTVADVVTVSVRGDYGIISQSTQDRVMLPVYSKTGRWAADTNERLIAFFAGRGGTYVDVGANIGLTTIPVAQNPNVDCVALEPDPSNFNYLSLNVLANCPYRNVTLYRLAAFSESKKLQFELSADNLGDHRIKFTDADGEFNERKRRTIEIDAVPLDDLVTPKRMPIAVKIDTQGAEPFVTLGGAKLLASAGLLIIEIWPYGIARMGGSVEPIVTLLRNNFDSVHLTGDGNAAPMSSKEAAAKLVQLMGRKDDKWFHVDAVASKVETSGLSGELSADNPTF
jgi:FkbM family methyltransferase